MTDEHPVDVLLRALREGPAGIHELSARTGFYPGPHLMLIVRARAQGHRITAVREDGITKFVLEEPDGNGAAADRGQRDIRATSPEGA